ncbi:MAG: hypothetical protein ACKO37_00385 [Vampirovibrionales bacterium]
MISRSTLTPRITTLYKQQLKPALQVVEKQVTEGLQSASKFTTETLDHFGRSTSGKHLKAWGVQAQKAVTQNATVQQGVQQLNTSTQGLQTHVTQLWKRQVAPFLAQLQGQATQLWRKLAH